MKTRILYLFVIVATLTGIVLAGCKKNNAGSTATPSNADLQTQSDDQTRVANENDAVGDDVSTALSRSGTIAGSSVSPGVRYGVTVDGGGPDTLRDANICGAMVVADTISNPHTLTIIYKGDSSYYGSSICYGNRTRTGVVVISIPAGVHWRDVGATVSVSIQNLKITRKSDNKSITLNGTHLYTNVSGGSLYQLYPSPAGPLLASITHTVTSSNMSITFDDGTQRTWNIARQRVYTYSNQVINVSLTGTHTDGATQGISEWGTNRFGYSFSTAIIQPLVISSGCGYQLISGQEQLTNADGMTTITFGLDSTGVATGCPIVGAYYYFKLVWAGNGGKTYTSILPY